jgi:hypothetical protein
MSTTFFQANKVSVEKMLVRINPGEVVKIIEENFDVYSRAGVMSFRRSNTTAQRKNVSAN